MNAKKSKNKKTFGISKLSSKLKRTVLLCCLMGIVPFLVQSQNVSAKKLLIFTKTLDYRHESTEVSIEAIKNLCAKNGIQVDATEDSKWFRKGKLKKYDAVVFLNSSGDVFNTKQEIAFRNYIQSGGGFVGIHGATTTEYDWEWFGKMIGGYFNGHPEPQNATVIINDNTHLSTKHLPKKWNRFDEWYNFRWVNQDFKVLLSLDENTYEGGGHKENHPIAWYKPFEGGRMFYTALGHTKESYSENLFLQHILGGIYYAMGK